MDNTDEVMEALERAKAAAIGERAKGKGGRELALVLTKIDEAILWRRAALEADPGLPG